ncbi:unnamed protein product [Adineta steineri]|uniref:protein-tyrosine-phosphatase n=1 Tax=Adineta steineri TaxID=433720 RepID=A0A814UAN2_9BILA|nr:unnamed protein product [Adineta steineri]CAF1399342.1 unnamed protein product [Adineta steineri]
MINNNIDEEEDNFLDKNLKDILINTLQTTNEELNYLEKLIKIQKNKINSFDGNRSQPSIVIDNFLYHGDLGHAIDMDLLLDLHIQHIINVCDCSLDDQIKQVFHVLWIKDLEDSLSSDIRKYFDQTNQFLEECKMKNEKVLVHCQAGISRSSSIVLAYLIRYHNDSLEKAYEYLLDRRPIAAPNYNFLIQLIRYEKELKNKSQLDDKQNPIKPIKDTTDF